MNILIFSDLHGRIPLMFRLIYEFQKQRDIVVDWILVCGDLGIWPDINRLDHSTRKYARNHPEELGFQVFHPFPEPCSQSEQDRMYRDLYDSNALLKQRMLQQKREQKVVDAVRDSVKAKIVFVGGNHEDYQYLESLCGRDTAASLIPVEKQCQINWLPAGSVLRLKKLAITGISGIDPEGTSRNTEKYHSGALIHEDSILDVMLQGDEHPIDILLTHDSVPDAIRPGSGSKNLSELLQTLLPSYHFFGHYHSRRETFDYHDLPTRGVHLNKLAFSKEGRLREHVMGFLQWSGRSGHEFHFVKDAWLSRVREDNWWKGIR